MSDSYTDKLLKTVDAAADKAANSIVEDWMKGKSVDDREDMFAEIKAITRVVTKLKRIIREGK